MIHDFPTVVGLNASSITSRSASSPSNGYNMSRYSNIALESMETISMEGRALGLVSLSPQARHKHSACEASYWSSDTALACRSSKHYGETKLGLITAGAMSGTVTEALSSNIPSVSRVEASNVPSSSQLVTLLGGTTALFNGTASITLSGSDMGKYLISVVAGRGGTACEATGWASDTAVRCLTGKLLQSSRDVALTVGSRAGTGSHAVSSDARALSAIKQANQATLASASITARGIRMGNAAYSGAVSVGRSSCERTLWVSESSLQCNGAAGISRSLRIAFSSSMLISTLTNFLTHDSPTLVGLNASFITYASFITKG